MSLLTRIANVFRGERVNREIDEELEAHVAQAMASGRDAEEARRALGSALRHREKSRDARIVTWLDSLHADTVFGWRQLKKAKVTSAAAILSLALAIGACTATFRLIDALLLRPLPIAGTERLYLPYRSGIGWDGKPGTFDGWAYPAFQQMRGVVKERADLLAISYGERVDLTYKSDQEMEKAQLQYVSGHFGAGAVGGVWFSNGQPSFLGSAGSFGGTGAAHCMRQCGQLDDGAGGGSRARNGAANFDWRGAIEIGAIDTGRERMDRAAGSHDRMAVCVVGRSVRRGHDQSA